MNKDTRNTPQTSTKMDAAKRIDNLMFGFNQQIPLTTLLTVVIATIINQQVQHTDQVFLAANSLGWVIGMSPYMMFALLLPIMTTLLLPFSFAMTAPQDA